MNMLRLCLQKADASKFETARMTIITNCKHYEIYFYVTNSPRWTILGHFGPFFDTGCSENPDISFDFTACHLKDKKRAFSMPFHLHYM